MCHVGPTALRGLWSERCRFVVEHSSAALQGGSAGFGERCHLHLKIVVYLFPRSRDLGLPNSACS